MLTVALTGGIASGKSVVAEVFARHGCALYRADQEARAFLAPGGPAVEPLAAKFGPAILAGDGGIDRPKLAALIFGRESDRRFVDGLIHPLVARARRREIARLAREDRTKIFVSEAALTIEAGLAGEFDKIVVVWCAPEIQVERLMARDAIPREEALRRIGAQMPAEEKLRFADYIIETSGSLERTLAQAEAVFTMLLADAGRHSSKRRREGGS